MGPNSTLSAVALTLLVVAGACTAPEPTHQRDARDTPIGVVYPLTGRLAEWGGEAQPFIRLAEEDANALPAAVQRRIHFRFVVRSDGTTAEGARAAVDDLVAQGIRVIVGFPLSQPLEETLPTLLSRRVAVLSSSSTGVAAALRRPDTLYRLQPSETSLAASLGAFARASGYTRLAIMHRSDDWGSVYANALAEPFRAAGDPVRTVAFRLSHPALGDHTAEVRDLAREVTALGVDERTAVVLVAWEGEDLDILRLAALDPALSRVRWLAAILYPSLTDGCMPVPPCVPEAPAFALAARLWGQESRIELGDTARRVWEKARASLGREPRLEHLYLYDALQVAARAFLTADSDDGDAIAAAFAGAAASYAALTGSIRFDANGDRLPNELAYYGLFRAGASTSWRHYAYFDAAAQRLTVLDPPRPRPSQFCPEC